MILGLVLGELMERYLYRSMMAYGFSWLLRPAVIILLILATVSFIYTLRGRLTQWVSSKAPAESGSA